MCIQKHGFSGLKNLFILFFIVKSMNFTKKFPIQPRFDFKSSITLYFLFMWFRTFSFYLWRHNVSNGFFEFSSARPIIASGRSIKKIMYYLRKKIFVSCKILQRHTLYNLLNIIHTFSIVFWINSKKFKYQFIRYLLEYISYLFSIVI